MPCNNKGALLILKNQMQKDPSSKQRHRHANKSRNLSLKAHLNMECSTMAKGVVLDMISPRLGVSGQTL